MSRRSTGLRNRYRKSSGKGRSTYSAKNKSRERDTYGEYNRGHVVTPDSIAGHQMSAIDQHNLKTA